MLLVLFDLRMHQKNYLHEIFVSAGIAIILLADCLQ